MKGLGVVILFSVVFWNLENFFDYFDGGYSESDREFSSRGAKHWTKRRFLYKVNLTGKTLLWCGGPDVVGLAEVENSFVLKRLIHSDILHKLPYAYVHFESRDPRGIDVALLYRKDRFEKVRAYPLPVVCSGDTLKTRDILCVVLLDCASGEVWRFYVNHHPSKYSGASSTFKRIAAMTCLIESIDSVAGNHSHVVAMGDFNDEPDGEAFSLVRASLVNAGKALVDSLGSECGSIRYHGHWQLIDNFLYSDGLNARMEVLHPDFLTTRDRSFPGDKPLRTYSGPRYIGGVSDHRPIRLIVD